MSKVERSRAQASFYMGAQEVDPSEDELHLPGGC